MYSSSSESNERSRREICSLHLSCSFPSPQQLYLLGYSYISPLIYSIYHPGTSKQLPHLLPTPFDSSSSSMSASPQARKRLQKEHAAFQKNPPPFIWARPNESNILEWHFIFKGSDATPFHKGEYWGVVEFPKVSRHYALY